MCVIFDCGHHHLESCLSTSPLTCDLAGLSKSKHGGFFSCLLVLFFFFFWRSFMYIVLWGLFFVFLGESYLCGSKDNTHNSLKFKAANFEGSQ